MDENIEKKDLPIDIEISDDDIYEAMKDIHGYLDITQADLKEIYKLAYRHALNRITRFIKARDIMTKQVFSVKIGTPLKDVAGLMAREKIAGLPVLDEDGKIAGIISEKDFLAHMGAGDKTHCMAIIAECLKGKGCIEMPIRSQKAEDIMTSPAVTVEENTTIIEIADIFTAKNINRVPVTDKEEKLIGIVSRADLVRVSLMKGKSSR
jgi:CBS domain-containing membrane protein